MASCRTMLASKLVTQCTLHAPFLFSSTVIERLERAIGSPRGRLPCSLQSRARSRISLAPVSQLLREKKGTACSLSHSAATCVGCSTHGSIANLTREPLENGSDEAEWSGRSHHFTPHVFYPKQLGNLLYTAMAPESITWGGDKTETFWVERSLGRAPERTNTKQRRPSSNIWSMPGKRGLKGKCLDACRLGCDASERLQVN